MFVLTGLVTDIFPLQPASSFQPVLLGAKAGEGVGRTASISAMDVARFGLDSAGWLHTASDQRPCPNLLLLGFCLQLPEGVPHGAVPSFRAAQVHSAPALHLLPLALCQPASSQIYPPPGWHI